jgi:uncharacterized OsmC-like protein
MAYNELTPTSFPANFMRDRQKPLARLYEREPAAALISDGARTVPGAFRALDPVHGALSIGTSEALLAPCAIHSAVGGDHDGPNPGDYLCAALVGCFDATLRIIANRMGISLSDVFVEAQAEIDVRGTLCLTPTVPVGFQRIRLNAYIEAVADTKSEALAALISAAKHCCIVYRTLEGGVDIEFRLLDASEYTRLALAE